MSSQQSKIRLKQHVAQVTHHIHNMNGHLSAAALKDRSIIITGEDPSSSLGLTKLRILQAVRQALDLQQQHVLLKVVHMSPSRTSKLLRERRPLPILATKATTFLSSIATLRTGSPVLPPSSMLPYSVLGELWTWPS